MLVTKSSERLWDIDLATVLESPGLFWLYLLQHCDGFTLWEECQTVPNWRSLEKNEIALIFLLHMTLKKAWFSQSFREQLKLSWIVYLQNTLCINSHAGINLSNFDFSLKKKISSSRAHLQVSVGLQCYAHSLREKSHQNNGDLILRIGAYDDDTYPWLWLLVCVLFSGLKKIFLALKSLSQPLT